VSGSLLTVLGIQRPDASRKLSMISENIIPLEIGQFPGRFSSSHTKSQIFDFYGKPGFFLSIAEVGEKRGKCQLSMESSCIPGLQGTLLKVEPRKYGSLKKNYVENVIGNARISIASHR
jgi:hypothetical protein